MLYVPNMCGEKYIPVLIHGHIKIFQKFLIPGSCFILNTKLVFIMNKLDRSEIQHTDTCYFYTLACSCICSWITPHLDVYRVEWL